MEDNYFGNQQETIFCPKCGEQFDSSLEACPRCGEKNLYVFKKEDNNQKKSKLSTVKLIFGIVTLCFFVLFFFQSCTLFSLGIVIDQETSSSGLLGLLGSICFMVAGILAIVARDKEEIAINRVIAGFYYTVFFFGCMARSNFPDAVIWGFLAYVFGTVVLFFIAHDRKTKIITAVISVIYLILGLI